MAKKKSFVSQVGRFVAQSDLRMQAVFKQSVQDVIEEVQESRDAGGKMPVVTGFLRNSGQAALNSIPSGRSDNPKGYKYDDWDATPSLLVVNQAELGDRVVFGWTANYARYMENKYAFMRSAAQNWNKIVIKNARSLEKAIKTKDAH